MMEVMSLWMELVIELVVGEKDVVVRLKKLGGGGGVAVVDVAVVVEVEVADFDCG
jgi:hypothetical protein